MSKEWKLSEVWSDIDGVEVVIRPFRARNEVVKIPGGDCLTGTDAEVKGQLERRGFHPEGAGPSMSGLLKANA